MNFDQLKYFLTIVKTGSFSEAADELFISQSSISKQIKSLEHELGIELFKREHSKIFLSSAGKKFVPYAKNAIKEHNDMRLYLDEFVKKNSKTIRIGSIPIVSAYGVSKNIAEFTTSYSSDINVVIDMHETNQDEVLKELFSGEIDIAIVRTEFLDNVDELDQIPYLKDFFVLVCNKEHPLSKQKIVSLSEAAKYPLSMLDMSSRLYTIVSKAFEQEGISIQAKCLTTRHKILLEILQKSNHIAILPDSLVDTKLFPNLVTIDIKEQLTSQIALTKIKKKRVNKITRDFWKYWQHTFQE